ncbi:hypothetical protein ACCO45_003033 [Purpureocillium lilacinum]|uniref:Uncharacterized protein n=1 Tax=Purpureocillium lilacinum TaxID=33203 RepID=A0ACC4DYT1_PURLI
MPLPLRHRRAAAAGLGAPPDQPWHDRSPARCWAREPSSLCLVRLSLSLSRLKIPSRPSPLFVTPVRSSVVPVLSCSRATSSHPFTTSRNSRDSKQSPIVCLDSRRALGLAPPSRRNPTPRRQPVTARAPRRARVTSASFNPTPLATPSTALRQKQAPHRGAALRGRPPSSQSYPTSPLARVAIADRLLP